MDVVKLYKIGNFFYRHKVPILAKFFTKFNYLIHNSYIPSQCTIGKGTKFGYGGMAVVLHKDSKIRKKLYNWYMCHNWR